MRAHEVLRLIADGASNGEIADQLVIAAFPETKHAVISLCDVERWISDEVCQALTIIENNQRVLLHRLNFI
jgi:hypothetical protein